MADIAAVAHVSHRGCADTDNVRGRHDVDAGNGAQGYIFLAGGVRRVPPTRRPQLPVPVVISESSGADSHIEAADGVVAEGSRAYSGIARPRWCYPTALDIHRPCCRFAGRVADERLIPSRHIAATGRVAKQCNAADSCVEAASAIVKKRTITDRRIAAASAIGKQAQHSNCCVETAAGIAKHRRPANGRISAGQCC